MKFFYEVVLFKCLISIIDNVIIIINIMSHIKAKKKKKTCVINNTIAVGLFVLLSIF